VAIAAAYLDDLIIYVLHARWLVYDDLASEHAVTEAELTLAVVSESV